MSTNLFSGARKALVASIAAAVLLGGVTVVTTPYAAASTVAAVSVSAKINAFTNTDWLNGVWRTGAGFSIPATSANRTAFVAGVSVRLADGQVRKISRAQIVGSNMSVFLEGAKLDGNKVGAPQVVTIGSTAVTAPITSTAPVTAPTTVAAHSTSINAFTNTDWLNGVWRKSPGFSIPASAANKAAFKVGASAKLADGQVRKVTQVQVVGANMSVYLEGAAVNGSVVGAPNKLSLATTSTTRPAPAPTAPTNSVIG